LIEAQRLTVRFKRGIGRRTLTALDGLDLVIGDGEFFALLGQNGAGKSTAMNCFLGLLRPSSGHVRVLGHAPVLGSRFYADIGFLPEEPHYHDYLTVDEAVRYYGGLTGKGSWKDQAEELMERLGVAEFRSLRLAKCSKGMKQKVGIVQCLLGDPRLLLLDEPMRGLDPLAVRAFRDILVERNRRGATIVMNSHILSEVEMVATRAAILDRGRVVAEGRLAELVPADDDAYVVEVEPSASFPDYFAATGGSAEAIEGVVPSHRFYDFLDFTRANRLQVFRCAVRKGTLEDAFLRVLKGPAGRA
jgi:ABC-type multidrug transport system ATPase subunit